MDVVVYLALAVLLAVFVVSACLLVIMCRRRYVVSRLINHQALRFSKLKHDNMDDFQQLRPYLSQTLSNNEWVFDVSGVLEHCVRILKLCHDLTDKLAVIPIDNISPHLNQLICDATARIVPRFDDVLHALAAKKVDLRLTEARVASLTSAVWALLTPFYAIDGKYREMFGGVLAEMEDHQRFLTASLQTVDEAIDEAKRNQSTSKEVLTTENRKPLVINHNFSISTVNETLLEKEELRPTSNGNTELGSLMSESNS